MPLAAHVPIITGEIGENDRASSFIDAYMDWADAHGISYLAWTFNTGPAWTCSGGPSLITDYSGDTTAFGSGVQEPHRLHRRPVTRRGIHV